MSPRFSFYMNQFERFPGKHIEVHFESNRFNFFTFICSRIAVRSDTCTMVAISLNIQQRVHPIIWTVTSLPFDCLRVLSIKKPIGGCLVVAINSLIYLNQSVPPYGVSLNSIADHSTSFPLSKSERVKKKKSVILTHGNFIHRTTRRRENQFGLCTNSIYCC